MKLKYKVKQDRATDKWYVYKNKNERWLPKFDTEADAIKDSLLREGLEISDKLNDVQERMVAAGMIDDNDPYGWRA